MVLWLGVALAGEADGLEAYLDRRLDVVDRDVSTVYAPGYDGSGRFWFVRQGGALVDAVTFATLVGDEGPARTLARRRSTRKAAGITGFVAGIGLGAATILVPSLRLSESEVAPAALGLGSVVSLGLGTWQLGRAASVRHPSTLYERDEAEQRARAYNESLRDELLGGE
jgi:hypothetical protein